MTNSRLEIDSYGNKYWFNSINQLHRENGPASIYKNGGKYWVINNGYHRIDGPAMIPSMGKSSWWIHNEYIRIFEID